MTDPRARLHLQALLDATHGDQITCPRVWIEALLTKSTRPATERDLTVDDLCQRYGRKRSAVRGWLESGRLPGAFKLNGRDWRVPPAALEAFDAAQRAGQGSRRGKPENDAPGTNLGAWRTVRGGEAA